MFIYKLDSQISNSFKAQAKIAKEAPYYQKLLKDIDPEDINDATTLTRIPFTDSRKLAENPYSFVPPLSQDKIEIVCSTTGYSGNPKYVFFTRRDLADQRRQAKFLLGALIRKKDKAIWGGVLGPQMGGTYIVNACAGLCPSLPISAYRISEIMSLLKKLDFNVLGLPFPFLLKLRQECENNNIDPKSFGLEKIIAGGLPLSARTEKTIEESFGAKVYDVYAMSEVGIIALKGECQKGYHLLSSNFVLPEIINKDNKTARQGELVLTYFNREGTQIIRYKTGDLVNLVNEDCFCKVNTPKIKLLGRSDDLLLIGYTNLLWDERLDAAIMGSGVKDYRVEVTRDKNGYDALTFYSLGKTNKENLVAAIKNINDDLHRQINNGLVKLGIVNVDKFKPALIGVKNKKVFDRRHKEES